MHEFVIKMTAKGAELDEQYAGTFGASFPTDPDDDCPVDGSAYRKAVRMAQTYLRGFYAHGAETVRVTFTICHGNVRREVLNRVCGVRMRTLRGVEVEAHG